MDYQEIKDIYERLSAEERWLFLFGLFGYKRVENHGFKKLMCGKYTWYRPDGKIIPIHLNDELPFVDCNKSFTWFQDGVIKKMEDNDFNSCLQRAMLEYFDKIRGDLGTEIFSNPMFYFVLPFCSQVFVLFLASKKQELESIDK